MKQIEKTITKTIYVADDGTEFEDEWDCITYEDNCFYDSIHALGKDGRKVFDYYEIKIFSIDSIDQITKFKDNALKCEAHASEIKRVTEKGVYVWRDDKEAFYKYPENF